MNNIGARLREERERLGLTQDDFAAAGGVGKRALIHYEKGERSPDASLLAAIATAGADVLYILTGQRSESGSAPSLSPKEQVVIDLFRKASEEKQNTVLGALLGASLDPRGVREVNMTNSAQGGIQIGVQLGGKVTDRRKSR